MVIGHQYGIDALIIFYNALHILSNCFTIKILKINAPGDLYKWEMFDNLRLTVDGSYGMTEGSDVVLTCIIPRLNDLFINTDITKRFLS